MVYDEFLFLDETSGATGSIYNVSHGEQLTLQVSPLEEGVDEVAINVLGQVDTKLDSSDESSWMTLATICLYDYSISDYIPYCGIYCVGISGIKKIIVVNGDESQYGKVKVFGTIS